MYEMEGALLDPTDPGWPVCLAAPAPAGRPPGPATRVRFRFPGSFRVPGVSPGRCPFPTWMYFYSSVPARRKRPGEATENFFVIHTMTVVIHA
jgi:hypothetical protein